MTLSEKFIKNEVPDFLGEELVFCDKLWVNRKRSLVVLARNLKCYQFYQKQLVNSIDLSETCLKNVASNLCDYKGPNSKWFKFRNDDSHSSIMELKSLSETSEQQTSICGEEHITTDLKISFGKFVYRNFEICKLYLLIHLWDKLLAIAMPDFVFVMQFESVHKHRIIHGKEKFDAILEIKLENGDMIYTNFQENENVNRCPLSNGGNDRRNIKQLMEQVRCAKAELQLYKSTTQKEFDNLRDFQTFGCNYIRSDQLEEKPFIARSGDIWLRYVSNNIMVLGVPLVNNCSVSSLIITKNLKPIFKMKDTCVDNIIYKYRIYQLKQNFENLETLETFFQTEDEELQTTPTIWSKCELNRVLPSSFAVLLIAIQTSQLLLVEECPLLLYFEVEKEHSLKINQKVETRIYEQHLFLKNLNINNIIMNRQKYNLSFETSNFYQDFLAIAMINKESTLHIQFESKKDVFLFEQLMAKKFNFDIIKRNTIFNECVQNDVNNHEFVGDKDLHNKKNYISCVYFNKLCTSLWFGSMALEVSQTDESEDHNKTWKLYLHNNENAFNCICILLNELTVLNCNIKNIDYVIEKKETSDETFLKIKNEIVNELDVLRQINECLDGGRKKIIFGELLKKQVRSDFLMSV
uniref:Uncharacterized protein n=1 Tax=Bactrocera dorsalis TaxID=27457 RepID=A0A034WL51_BACDO